MSKQPRQVIRTAARHFAPYDRYGKTVSNMHWLPLSGESGGGDYECYLLRLDPGAASQPHEHTGHEEFLVLEGQLVDHDGTVFEQGDFVKFAPGSQHWSASPQGCLLLVILHGPNRALTATERQALDQSR